MAIPLYWYTLHNVLGMCVAACVSCKSEINTAADAAIINCGVEVFHNGKVNKHVETMHVLAIIIVYIVN